MRWTRRQVLVVVAALLVGPRRAPALPPTPGCGEATPPETEGPFHLPNAPYRASLVESDMDGVRLVVSGTVLTTDCRPLPGAILDFWQADAAGRYDVSGYRLRGRVRTDDGGRYRLETIVPGRYPGRTPHLHVEVEASTRRTLTTQLYFPDEPSNARDALFRRELVMNVGDAGGVKLASFDFVLRA